MNKTDIINHALTLLGQATVISAEGAPAMDALFNNSKKGCCVRTRSPAPAKITF